MSALPRLALITEVVPLNRAAGHAVLYRLLRPYPAERLLLCTDPADGRQPEYELQGVAHASLPFGWRRLRGSRFNIWHGTLTTLFQSTWLAGRLVRRLRAFRAEAVVSVAHGTVWWPAWVAAHRLGLPFHLIVHDHWRASYSAHRWTDRLAERHFTTVYRNAASRLLISGAMAERYRAWYGGGEAVVLFPSQLPETEIFAAPPDRPAQQPFVFAYAGAMDGQWARDAIVGLAHAVAPLGARVRVYGHTTMELLRAAGLRGDNVEVHPFLSTAELHREFRTRVDALYLPMSFTPGDRENVEVCFPSKMTDYTVPGLPILACTPDYSSIAAWLVQQPGALLRVNRPDEVTLRAAAASLINDPALRRRYGEAALAAGREYFRHERAFAHFASALRAPGISAP